METITVAIADEDGERRAKFEHSLQGEQGIKVLTNTTSIEGEMTVDRRLNPRTNISSIDNVVARIRRLNPRILLANMKQCTDANCAMLVSLRRECPETLVVLLADEQVPQEEKVIQALASGARGYLNIEADSVHFSKAMHVIDRGEAWVPRIMLGKIMNQVFHWCHGNSIEAQLDTSC
jgi:DNA-binding NarL/FixJ family response regulator